MSALAATVVRERPGIRRAFSLHRLPPVGAAQAATAPPQIRRKRDVAVAAHAAPTGSNRFTR
ncbi:hypothetical protein AZ78_3043 [Lysobacter capsici AZ78]|uniref:Uncharacterized protein n=1 Tax=Lysobacter capsici AZ78 TaxID=1444315 RepID=A0A108UAE0_9GAMM|nr:hypothetical protein AZ78_3043 [Lysobacter capsici AZ78]